MTMLQALQALIDERMVNSRANHWARYIGWRGLRYAIGYRLRSGSIPEGFHNSFGGAVHLPRMEEMLGQWELVSPEAVNEGR